MEPIPFNFRQIDYLIAVAETGSTAAAARLLNVSQPSVSVAVAQFEELFGEALFLRHLGKGMQLTPFGRQQIARLRALRTQASDLLGPPRREPLQLRLGVYSTLGPLFAPMLMRRFVEANPGATITLVEGNIEKLSDAILSGNIDCALVYDVGLSPDLNIVNLVDNAPHAVLPPDHNLAGSQKVSLAALAENPLILINLPHSRGYFLSLFHTAGAHPRIAYETESLEMLRALVANGHGVGLLATSLPYDLTYDGRRIVQRSLEGSSTPSRVVLASAARQQKTEAMNRFESLTRNYFEKAGMQG